MTEMLTVQAAKSSVSMITPQRSSSGADTGAAQAEALLAQTLGAEEFACQVRSYWEIPRWQLGGQQQQEKEEELEEKLKQFIKKKIILLFKFRYDIAGQVAKETKGKDLNYRGRLQNAWTIQLLSHVGSLPKTRTPPGNCIMSVASQTLLIENCISCFMLAKIFVQYGYWTVFEYFTSIDTFQQHIL